MTISILKCASLAACISAFAVTPLSAQDADNGTAGPSRSSLKSEQTAQPSQPVTVVPTASDAEIANRLARILKSTGWFDNSRVSVRDGVVTLDGVANTQEHRAWAGDLAAKTEGTVAVVNRIEVNADVSSTFGLAGEELARLARQAAQSWPIVVLGLLVIAIAWLFSRVVGALARRFFINRIESPLLLAVLVRLFAIPVFLLGVYFVLQVAGLTRLAITVLGGTGLVGIIIGFAFRDIAENFLASLLLSIRNPFRRGDLIEVAGHTGIVQNLNHRTTVLLTLKGNHVQIPNATVYKNIITNFSSNPSRSAEFTIGISYDSPIAEAQRLIGEVLRKHPAVLEKPKSLVLVRDLGASTVNLKVTYWFDSATYAPDKINSALLRISKSVLLQAGIELPDPAREVVFPKGVPVRQVGTKPDIRTRDRPETLREDEEKSVTTGEGNLSTECPEIEDSAPSPEPAENLLKS